MDGSPLLPSNFNRTVYVLQIRTVYLLATGVNIGIDRASLLWYKLIRGRIKEAELPHYRQAEVLYPLHKSSL